MTLLIVKKAFQVLEDVKWARILASAHLWEATAVMAMFEQMRENVGKLLKGIDRYNPENLVTL